MLKLFVKMTNLWTATSTASMIFFIILATTVLIGQVHSNDNLRVAFEWKEIDFKYANAEERWSAIERYEFKPNNVIPFGIEVYQSRLFVTLPRWRDGVPASLAYLDLNGKCLFFFFCKYQNHNYLIVSSNNS